MNKKFWLGLAAYVVPTFPLGFVWHLVVFAPQYHELQIYRSDVIIPFGLLSMLIQGSYTYTATTEKHLVISSHYCTLCLTQNAVPKRSVGSIPTARTNISRNAQES